MCIQLAIMQQNLPNDRFWLHCLAIAKKYHVETIAVSQFHSYSKGSARLVFFSISCTFSTQSRLKISTQNH